MIFTTFHACTSLSHRCIKHPHFCTNHSPYCTNPSHDCAQSALHLVSSTHDSPVTNLLTHLDRTHHRTSTEKVQTSARCLNRQQFWPRKTWTRSDGYIRGIANPDLVNKYLCLRRVFFIVRNLHFIFGFLKN